jgi:hypothetical protein
MNIPLSEFLLPRFISCFLDFWKDNDALVPPHEAAFAFVGENGSAYFADEMQINEEEPVGDSPMEWLQHGLTLFAHFTRQDDRIFEGLDGTKWDDETETLYEPRPNGSSQPRGDCYDGDPDDDEIFDAAWNAVRQQDEARKAAEPNPEPDDEDDEEEEYWHELTSVEIGTYGFLISLNDDQLSIQMAVLEEVMGECMVRVIEDAGPFQEPMRRFLDSMRL